jgi:hypothetical protein
MELVEEEIFVCWCFIIRTIIINNVIQKTYRLIQATPAAKEAWRALSAFFPLFIIITAIITSQHLMGLHEIKDSLFISHSVTLTYSYRRGVAKVLEVISTIVAKFRLQPRPLKNVPPAYDENS